MSTWYRLPDNDPTPEEHREAVTIKRVKLMSAVTNAAINENFTAHRDDPDLHVAEGMTVERAIMRMLDGFLVVDTRQTKEQSDPT